MLLLWMVLTHSLNCFTLCPSPSLHLSLTESNASKRQAADEAAKARKNKERMTLMFAKAAGKFMCVCEGGGGGA